MREGRRGEGGEEKEGLKGGERGREVRVDGHTRGGDGRLEGNKFHVFLL